jgi:hypothetical protein
MTYVYIIASILCFICAAGRLHSQHLDRLEAKWRGPLFEREHG